MKLTIIHYTVLIGVSLILFLLKNRKSTRLSKKPIESAYSQPDVVDSSPDRPVGFGYKCIWFAVKTINGDMVAKEIGLKNLVQSNWKSGVAAAYNGQVFVSPPVSGWTLVVGQDLPTFDDADRKKTAETLLIKLSAKFLEVHQYASHRVVEFHAWAKAVQGKILREYAYLGESGETLQNSGNITTEEIHAGVVDAPDYQPNEEVVMAVAEKWSLNPTKLGELSGEPATGWVGNF